MAHEVYQIDGEDSMAYVGDTPWHGLGQKIDPDASLEDWIATAHMDWEIKEGAVGFFRSEDGLIQSVPNRKALYRSDNGEYLSTVGINYHPVQPPEVIEFFRSLVESGDFKMETAGSLFHGRRLWALANIGKTARIMGQDEVRGYLLLATACDGTLANTGLFTVIRVVCNNTLEFSLFEAENEEGERNKRRCVKIPHSRKFDPDEMKAELGLGAYAFDEFVRMSTMMAGLNVTDLGVAEFLTRIHLPADYDVEDDKFPELVETEMERSHTKIGQIFDLYHNGPGSDLKSSKGTLWGAVNAVTRFYDHERRSQSTDNRLNSAWFGAGARVKKRAWDLAEGMVKAA
jgi:phage/plasmid-like protein (TIGR03299 family)